MLTNKQAWNISKVMQQEIARLNLEAIKTSDPSKTYNINSWISEYTEILEAVKPQAQAYTEDLKQLIQIEA